MIEVLIVEDSSTVRKIMSSILQSDPEITIVGEVSNGREAISFLERAKRRPDLITADIHMPVMNGFDMIEYIMAYFPIPILVVTNLGKDTNYMRALSLGALDVIEKPALDEWNNFPKIGLEIIEKIKLLSRVKVVTHLSGKKRNVESLKKLKKLDLPAVSEKVVVIASSTGGPNTLLRLLKLLPGNFPAPIFIVQHMSENCFIEGMADWFRISINMNVETIRYGDVFASQTVYFAPAGKHLIISKTQMLSDNSKAVKNIKPAADYLFKSAVKHFKSNVIGVILTGIGDDGTEGAVEIFNAGGVVLAQDEASSIVYGMPKAVAERNVVSKVADMEGIAQELLRLVIK